MQDMTPPRDVGRNMGRGDRSIRNIPVPEGHRSVRPGSVSSHPLTEDHQDPTEPMYEEDFSNPPPRRPQPRKGFFGGKLFWALVIVVVICAAAGLLMSTMFAGATVKVTPRSATVTAPTSIQAQVNAPAGVLPYQVINSSRTASTSVPASGTKQVSLSAMGAATNYNAFSTASQDLVATTRFEAPDGKMYRIHANVTVPGATKAADGSLTPGTVTATLYADKPGADYNRTAPTQFTIPGFKGDAKFTKFYAQATVVSGGLVGLQPAVSTADLATAEGALKQGLSQAMNDMVQSQVPKEYVAVPGTLQVSYNDIVQTPGPNNTAVLSQTANASADVIRSTDLASAIAKQTVQGYAGEAVTFADASQISIALATSSKATGAISLTLSGSPKLVWQFDPNALQQALIGKPKAQFETILKTFAPAITCSTETPCQASIRPFWGTTFPGNAAKIQVITGAK
jgi:hypothetical protein